jgi:formate dehydrogenase subunit beta
MNKSWFVETHGDPLGVIQDVISTAWEEFELDHIVVSANGNGMPALIKEPDEIREINPFRPLMTKNTAKYIPAFQEDNPTAKLGAVLRPCELRALKEKSKRCEIQEEHLLTICVDCLGTYPQEDYQWRAERKGSPERLAWESLHFARQGGIASYRFRSACQACRSPVSDEADLNIGVIGLPVRQVILLAASGQVSDSLLPDTQPGSRSNPDLMKQREYVVAKLLQRSANTRQRLADNLESILPRDVDALVEQFESCGDCRDCFDVCPMCSADYPSKDPFGRYQRQQVKDWMISCAGCGMCEQACPNHLPLVTIFGYIREQLREPLTPLH